MTREMNSFNIIKLEGFVDFTKLDLPKLLHAVS